ncbi:DUF6436 domain-containing protein [Mucilaginibacter koreensis]
MKKLFVYLWLLLLFVSIGAIFWHQQYQYSLPTPIPQGYKPIPNGAVIHLDSELGFNNHKPVLLHFFNPDCPCSRFNIQHVKSLISRYGNRVNFAVVLMNEKYYTRQQVKEKYNLSIPVIVNPALALACGVYSTPQAAILTTNRQLYYRGNYNSNRYCTNTETEYARIALTNLLEQKPAMHFTTYATTAYGCSLSKSYN